MRIELLRLLPVAFCAAMLALTAHSAQAQSGGDSKTTPKAAIDPAKPKIDEYAEARRLMVGPAGEPECVWLGRRIVGLLYRDDPDNAQRNLDVYDRFRCPGTHVQEAFRCVVRQGSADTKLSPEAANALTNERINVCWINPATPTQPTAASPSGSASTAR